MIRLRTENTHYGNLRTEDRTRVDGTKKETTKNRGRDTNLKAYCLCGSTLCNTTSKDIYNGVQPRCRRCKEF